MGKKKGHRPSVPQKGDNYIAKQKRRNRVLQDATTQTFRQYMADTLIITLNDPEVMGKDVFGHKRIMRVLEAWGKKYDLFFEALTNNPETDYTREKLDALLRQIIKPPDFVPFEKRYDWLPEITYEPKK